MMVHIMIVCVIFWSFYVLHDWDINSSNQNMTCHLTTVLTFPLLPLPFYALL